MESSQMPKRSRREDWAKGMPVQPVFLAEKKGNKPSDIVEIPKGDEALGYGSLPLTVTMSVETHLQSKPFLSSLPQAGGPCQLPCQSFISRGLIGVYQTPCRFDSLISQANCVA